MKHYVMLYRGGNAPEGKEAEVMQAWGAFMEELGKSGAMQSGMPFAGGKVVTETSVEDYKSSENDVAGFNEIKVESEEIALKIAKMAPNLKYGGSVELREEMDIPGM